MDRRSEGNLHKSLPISQSSAMVPEAIGTEWGQEDPLFPEIEPHNAGFLDVGQGHRLYFEECGNPCGLPVLVLHGGPGTGATPTHRRFFDPKYYRIVIFDQRGAGRSRPLGSLKENTTQHLIQDIETLRTSLAIKEWLVFGSSWGTTLALTYGITHPEPCVAFALHALALPREEGYLWCVYGQKQFFPEEWRRFASHVGEAEQADLLGAYYQRLIDSDPAVHMPAARSWIVYDTIGTSVGAQTSSKLTGKTDEQILAMARIQAHYFKNIGFIDFDWFLTGLNNVQHLPAYMTHGRYDIVCTPDNADFLAQLWKNAKLQFIGTAGHSYREPENAAAIIHMTEAMKKIG